MIRRFAHLFPLITSALFLVACAQTPTDTAPMPELVFPLPPDEPRFVFERFIVGSADLKIDDRESRLRRLLTGEQTTGVGFAKPFDVIVCQGMVSVSDTVQRSVFQFDAAAHQFREVGRNDPGALRKPMGLATDNDCNLYVADATARRVSVYDREGRFLRNIGNAGHFERLSHVAVSPDGTRLYAVDTGGVRSDSHRVQVFDTASGDLLFNFGGRGDALGKLNLPRDIDIGADGLVRVVDGGNFRVQVFNLDGEPIREFGSIGRRSGQFARPKGIGIDADGNTYVSDASHGNFQIFDEQGQLLLFIGERSEQPVRAGYMLPAGIDVDEDGRVYMVDQYFRRVDVYRPVALDATEGYLGAW